MSKQAKVTRDDVYRVADTMMAEGLRPSVRNVQAQLGGGSHSTITRHLRAWREQQGEGSGTEIPGNVLDAISLHVADSVARKTQQLSERLEAAETDLTHLADVLGAREREIESLRSDLATADDRLKHTEELAANRQAELERLQVLLETKTAELQEVLQNLAQASARVEVTRSVVERETQRAAQLDEMLRTTQEQLQVIRGEKVDLEGRMAAMTAECQRLQSQVTELTHSLERSAGVESDLNAALRDSVNDLRQQLERERRERITLANKLVQLTTSRQK